MVLAPTSPRAPADSFPFLHCTEYLQKKGFKVYFQDILLHLTALEFSTLVSWQSAAFLHLRLSPWHWRQSLGHHSGLEEDINCAEGSAPDYQVVQYIAYRTD